MSAGDEFKDPWGWLVAAVSGGLTWAVVGGPSAALAGTAVGAAVLGTKVAIGAVASRNDPKSVEGRPDRLPDPTPNSIQARLLGRAALAGTKLTKLVGNVGDPWLRGQLGDLGVEAGRAVPALRDLAGRIEMLDRSLADLGAQDVPRQLARARVRVDEVVGDSVQDRALRAERQRLVDALQGQADSQARMRALRETMLTRLESSALELEGLVARASEIVAGSAASIDVDRNRLSLEGLKSDLETLRGGLDAAAAMAHGSLPPE